MLIGGGQGRNVFSVVFPSCSVFRLRLYGPPRIHLPFLPFRPIPRQEARFTDFGPVAFSCLQTTREVNHGGIL